MQSKAATVEQYLAELPEDRRAAIAAVRETILKNLDKDYEEGMTYGMIGYYVPHRLFPAGYHCNPTQPLPFANLASQKQHMALYIMGLYSAGDGSVTNETLRWFQQAWAKTGKKLDMGKACIRFKKLDDLPLEVIGEAIRRLPAKTYIKHYEAALAMNKTNAAARREKKAAVSSRKAAKKPTASRSRSR
jgi:hypothetical protein